MLESTVSLQAPPKFSKDYRKHHHRYVSVFIKRHRDGPRRENLCQRHLSSAYYIIYHYIISQRPPYLRISFAAIAIWVAFDVTAYYVCADGVDKAVIWSALLWLRQ